MKATPRQMLQLGTIVARCDLDRMLGNEEQSERVLAGLVSAAAILLPPEQWDHFRIQAELDGARLSHLLSLMPRGDAPSPAPVKIPPPPRIPTRKPTSSLELNYE